LAAIISKLEKIEAPFPRISYDDAVKNLQEGFAKGVVEAKFEWGGDFGSPDETYLSAQFDKPVMVHRYPAKVKAFYMEPDPQRPELALCVDVLAPEGYGEIIGGSQRMASHELLLQRIHEHGLAGRSVQVVFGFAQVRQRAARWLWHGHRKSRGVDLRAWSMCARRFRSPAC
jgi:asparaginyl-tRNA synthetase